MLKRVAFYLSIAFTMALLTSCGDAIEVVVQNNGPDVLKDVKVRTYQDSYMLGDIPPGESRSESFDPSGDSNLAISYTSRPEWQDIDVYVTRGVAGQITLEMENGEIVNFDSTVRP